MNYNYPNKGRKNYCQPIIEEIAWDREISLIMESPPGDPPGNGGGTPLTSAPAPATPDYKDQTYKTKDPFGGSKPAY